ncbi:mitogen-activated protein kinase-binding protein 1 [Anabrus simplex]|uniref:mitogen-activated protein kinase-binding protein 1 n=1 Tax=Anabrus simplex TaxID=316456 RepID=UPI0034DD883C
MLATKNLANAARDKENTPAYEVKLERVLGLTVSSNAALDCDPATELVAYPAGCTVVLFNPRKGRQQHLLNTSRKTITCLAFSSDGRYLATGECGHLPSVRVWEVTGADIVQVAEFPGHKYGINCVAFSPSHKYVVSVGSQHDMIVNVWDWRANVKVASNKVSTKVKAVSFAENGNYFVTVGNRHVKFWYLEYSRSAKYKDPVPLMGRSAILGEQRNNYFCDVACGRGDMGDSTYAITKSGLLCEFNNRRLLDKWVELRTTSANCMAVGETFIFIGCAEGIIRCFSPATLQFVTTLPRTHYLGVDVAQGLSIAHMATPPANAKYPDAVALAYDPMNHKLTCVYNDHSLYVWDVHDIKRVGKSHSFLFHSACIWGVDMYPVLDPEVNNSPAMPPGCFITCSSDDTIRVWNLDPNLSLESDSVYKRNIYSNELLKVLYVDKELTYLKDLDLSGAGASEKADTSYDGRNGVRSIRISPDGKHLASGDRSGNIRIHLLKDLQELCRIEAHDAEVLCLEYSRHDSGHRLLASASRDRLIHVFSVDEEYNFLQTLDDHSSSITAVRFLNSHEQLQMVSCGADKSIIFRQLQGSPGGTQNQFSRGHNVAGKTTLYDMEVDSGQKHILTACQDRNIRVYNVSSGKHSKTFKGSVGEDGSLIKVVLDNSGIYAATSCTDKTLCIYDYYSGECMATMFGHSELVTGLRFTNDCRRLVSASGDGCIFMWKVPHDMVVTMHARLAQQAARAGRRPVQIPNGLHLDNENFGPPPPEFLDPNANSMDQTDYRFSVGQLPLWAKKQIVDNSGTSPPLSNRQMDLPKGRWAQRLDARSITVKSVYDSDSIIPLPITQAEKRTDSEGSKDSSIDSGTELRGNYSDYRQETVIISKQVSTGKMTLTRGSDGTDSARSRHLTDDSSIGSYKYEDMESTEHDGDVEDYSEGEGESTEPEQLQRLIYYPPAEETGSDYTVNAMDSEELRRSVRRHKKNHVPERLLDVVSVSASVSGSQDSDEDDEDASTPSAETADRNILSMLSVSTESLDMVGQREKFLKNTFESLSGAEMDAERIVKDTGGTSISSQFLVRASLGGTQLRNVAVINAAKQARSDTETSRKREELQRRIEETRRKLQSVGYRSNLKSSQSITDLSHYPEKDGRSARASNHAHRYTSAGDSDEGADIESGNLRRSCSLSDLASPAPRRLLHASHVQVSGKVSNKGANVTRTLPRHSSKQSLSVNSNMIRSTSMGMLNQSDSESDLSFQRSNNTAVSRINGLMRPTISSQNKVNNLSSAKNTSNGPQPRRRGLQSAYSSVNLSQVGNNEDSSSEETSPVGGKPGGSTRPRSTSIDRASGCAPNSLPLNANQAQTQSRRGSSSLHSRYGSDRDLSRGAREVTQRLASSRGSVVHSNKPVPAARHSQLNASPQELPDKNTDTLPSMDIASAPLSQQLCSTLGEQLTRTADSVVQLYKRLALEGDGQIDRETMLRGLEEAASEAQRTLRRVGASTNTSAVSVPSGASALAQDPQLASKLESLVSSGQAGGTGDQGNMVVMMQQYTDMLLTLVQQRMSTPDQQKPS